MIAASLGELIARYRLHLSFVLFVAVAAEWLVDDGGRPHPILSLVDLPHPIGLALIALGLGLRSWAAGVIDKRRTLTTGGPYSMVRHPLYAGSYLIGVGFAASMEDGLAIVAAALLIPAVYAFVVPREERLLAERFGAAWEGYAAQTPRFVPRLPLRPGPGQWQWRAWRRNREWRVLARTVAVLVLLEWLNDAAVSPSSPVTTPEEPGAVLTSWTGITSS
ncbi:S-isoprenylcysteine methyltransferase [Sulfurifustis variabilis]|uniref:S-isoprenylcysteine methyltransferase n=1 Tax=Sulfurifustis variabilis TaxID=1675686 RepID=A0A1C7AEU4_9GAMM|nr:isoprenylcysteine carboxylmethyltransferase family protein [Sulfurifustis variabilis]BAU49692.1 S-isoprenylcysteine methyltransferase [Sulfurifustis variabilis]